MSSSRFVRLREILVAPLRRGSRRREDGDGRSIPFVTTKQVALGPEKLASAPSERSIGRGRAWQTREGDILLVSRGLVEDRPVGCTVIGFAEPAAYSAYLLRIRVDLSRAIPDYVRIYLTSTHGSAALVAASTGTAWNNLRPSSLAEVEIMLPDLAEQEAIVEIITGLEKQMAKVEVAQAALASTHDAVREGLIAGVLKVSGQESATSR